METVRIYRLSGLARATRERLRAAQMEAARVWNVCRELHQEARLGHQPWPDRHACAAASLQGGQFVLHSKTHSAGLPPVPRQCGNHPAAQTHASPYALPL
jgi:putative transposase